ncbi:MAG: glycolate oxidase subunit GlcF [Novosphingobium sp.]|nr:glycolate oxidase subunit GlcF [Novosphingobium sp.]
MQTRFPAEALADPAMAVSEAVIRKCVHCGFCTATCPTYVLLGDELDSPRGRIYLIKEMLENGRKPTADVVKHIDRCLSCLSCMTTCPSGVNYMHLVDHARAYIEREYRRPWHARLLRRTLAAVLPYPRRFRAALVFGRLARPAIPLLRRIRPLRAVAAMLSLVPGRLEPAPRIAQRPTPNRKGRVVLLQGCAEPVLRPGIREATVRVLDRAGFEAVLAPGEGCCGALVHHLGRERQSLDAARRNVDAWTAEIERAGLDAIVITASGCGTTIKDYGFMLREDPAYAEKAARVSALAKDITEFLAAIELPAAGAPGLRVAYHPACSLQHGQRVKLEPVKLLVGAGYDVHLPEEAHLCCGSAGTYNILHADIADRLGKRKGASLERLEPDVIATGNIGCATQIARYAGTPVVHVVELLDWATGGPPPPQLRHHIQRRIL